jgi:3-oxoacyl-ACP reductase-like protein
MIKSTLLENTDKIIVVDIDGNTYTEKEVTFDEVRTRLFNDPIGMKEVRSDETYSLAALGAKFKATITVPAGAVIKYIAASIVTLVVAGGTTVKLAIGVNDDDVNEYLTLSALTAGTKSAALIAPAVLASQKILDINGIVTDGSALGDTNISAGSVRVVVVYDVANAL